MSAFHWDVNILERKQTFNCTYRFEEDSTKTMGHKYNRSVFRLEQFRSKQLLSGIKTFTDRCNLPEKNEFRNKRLCMVVPRHLLLGIDTCVVAAGENAG